MTYKVFPMLKARMPKFLALELEVHGIYNIQNWYYHNNLDQYNNISLSLYTHNKKFFQHIKYLDNDVGNIVIVNIIVIVTVIVTVIIVVHYHCLLSLFTINIC